MQIQIRDGEVLLDLDDPSLRLTPHQKRAMALDREIVLSAGAGAGKGIDTCAGTSTGTPSLKTTTRLQGGDRGAPQ